MTALAPAAPADAPDHSLVRWSVVVAAGIFASTLALPDMLDLPVKNLLRTELKLGRDEVSLFISLSGLPWYLKIFAGLLSDCFPLFGTRRRHYLIFAGSLAAVCWLIAGHVGHGYWPLLFALMATHTMLVFVSTVTAALIVEAGKRLRAEGQLVTVRIMVESACGIVAGPIAGFLAGQDFAWTGVAGAIIAATIVPAAVLLLREPPAARYDGSALHNATAELHEVVKSRALWLSALFLVIVNAPQVFTSVLYFHQTEQLGFANIDIGYPGACAGIASVATAALYGTMRAKFTLRILLVAAILSNALFVTAFLFYRSWQAAIAIEILRGVLATVAVLVLMEVAVRATPARIAAMAFALLMSAWNIGVAVGDYAGAWLVQYKVLTFYGLAGWFAVLSALTLFALPLLPRALFVEPNTPDPPHIDAVSDSH
jgi:predicted MFS family arabinose efflux permease